MRKHNAHPLEQASHCEHASDTLKCCIKRQLAQVLEQSSCVFVCMCVKVQIKIYSTCWIGRENICTERERERERQNTMGPGIRHACWRPICRFKRRGLTWGRRHTQRTVRQQLSLKSCDTSKRNSHTHAHTPTNKLSSPEKRYTPC